MSWTFLKYIVPASICRQPEKPEDGGSEEDDQEEGEEGEDDVEDHFKVLL